MFKLHGQLWFACIARSEDLSDFPQERLSGQIFIVSYKKRQRKQARIMLKTAQEKMRKSELSSGYSNNEIRCLLEDTAKGVSCLSGFWVEFCLCRNGETTIRLDTAERFCANATQIADGDDKNYFHDLLCRQAFYFLKDICHRHQHHSPKTDTLADLYVSSDDVEWRREVLYALYRKIIHFKRNRTEDAILDSMGTLAYAQAFQTICGKNTRDGQLPDFDNKSLACSLESAYKELTLEKENRRDRRTLCVQLLFSILGVFLTTISLLQVTGTTIRDPSHSLVAIATYFLRNPTECLGVLAAPVLIAIYKPWYAPVIYGLVRWLQPLGKTKVVFICGVLAAFFLLVFLALLLDWFWAPP